MRCPAAKFITHTLSHLCFLILLAAATFRLDEQDSITEPDNFDRHIYDHMSDDEKIESLLKATFRPENTLLTDVQICLMFWILGNYNNTFYCF